jgi:two-component system phosphate regulon response regulator PhoB
MTPPLILIVDHDQPTREMISFVLAECAYVVQDCDSHTTLRQIQEARPALIILELWPFAPDQTLKLVRQLRRRAATQTTPIIVTSTDPRLLADAARSLTLHGCLLLEKPFDLDDLFARVDQALGHV